MDQEEFGEIENDDLKDDLDYEEDLMGDDKP